MLSLPSTRILTIKTIRTVNCEIERFEAEVLHSLHKMYVK
jgi:hypothetical protein